MEKKQRKRFKTNGLIIHATEGKFIFSEESKLKRKFDAGEMTEEEKRKYASFMAVHKKSCKEEHAEPVVPKTVFSTREVYYVKCIGIWTDVPKRLYDGYPEESRRIEIKKFKTLAI